MVWIRYGTISHNFMSDVVDLYNCLPYLLRYNYLGQICESSSPVKLSQIGFDLARVVKIEDLAGFNILILLWVL